MSRSGYSDSCDGWELIRWRGAVASAIGGKRGQHLLREMRDALDAMPVKRLIAEDLVTPEGEVCALGAVGCRRNLPGLVDLDVYDRTTVARAFGVAEALVAEIAYKNDDEAPDDPARRWAYMRRWVDEQLAAPEAPHAD